MNRQPRVVLALLTFAQIATAGVTTSPVAEAVSKSIAALQRSQDEWKIPCISCHHQSLPHIVYRSARAHGVAVDEERARAHAAKTFRVLSGSEMALQMPLDSFAFGYALLALEDAGVSPGLTQAIVARRFAHSQQADGHWGTSDGRPPHSYSVFASTALAIRAIDRHLPATVTVDRAGQFAKARHWLRNQPAISTEDSTFRLLGLHWAKASSDDLRYAAADLLNRQLGDGSWPQMPGLKGDAYSTGEALVALRRSGILTASDRRFQRGIAFLLATQKPDGSWLVETRLHSKAQISPPFFDSGFPGGKDQFISCAATSWAALALLEALSESAQRVSPLSVPEADSGNVEEWVNIALFGSVDDLRNLLDTGLDPNKATKNGTTLLMFAAPDEGKVKLLLDRGATANTVGPNGSTALNLAATYVNGGASVRVLLERGAKFDPVNSPLSAAAMAGNVVAVRALLERGASPSGNPESKGVNGMPPLMSALMSDEREVVHILVKAGADVNAADENDMTPLIWASVMHRTEMVKTLLELGADPRKVDKFGETALDHTADILHYGPATAAALKAATTLTSAR